MASLVMALILSMAQDVSLRARADLTRPGSQHAASAFLERVSSLEVVRSRSLRQYAVLTITIAFADTCEGRLRLQT